MSLTNFEVTDEELAALLKALRQLRTPVNRADRRAKKRGRGRSVLYLRVSSKGQLRTDFDPDGLSIPAQEEAGRRKAEELDSEVVAVFIDRAETGTKIENRKDLLRMLEFLKSDGSIDYVIVPKVDRFARDVGDDAILTRWVRKYGAELKSCAENIDETPSGELVHGVHAVFAKFYSANLRTEVIKGMRQKVRNGGTPTYAKLGYVNVQVDVEGHLVRSTAIDKVRGPLVTQAFKWCATGRYTTETLTARLVKAGLTLRAQNGPKQTLPERPITADSVRNLLRDRTYLGEVYDASQDEWVPGRHEALTDEATFDRVQRILDSHSGVGVRQRRHNHYLKGAIGCHRCGHRLLVLRSEGNGGVYFYFFCRGRQLKVCNLPYMLVEDIELAIERHYAGRHFAPELAAAVRERFSTALDNELAALDQVKTALTARLDQIDKQEDSYLALVGNPKWPQAKLEAKIEALRDEREGIEADLIKTAAELDVGRQIIALALDYLDDPHALYKALSPTGRRLLNTIFFGRLALDVEPDGVRVASSTDREPFKSLMAAQDQAVQADTALRAYGRFSGELSVEELVAQLWPKNDSRGSLLTDAAPAWDSWSASDLLLVGLSDHGWSKAALVGQAGLEPATEGL